MGDLQGARNAGQIVPLIADMATGSFTAAGQTQTAYVIFVSECNASHADNFGTKRLAIFSGQQLVANVDLDFRRCSRPDAKTADRELPDELSQS